MKTPTFPVPTFIEGSAKVVWGPRYRKRVIEGHYLAPGCNEPIPAFCWNSIGSRFIEGSSAVDNPSIVIGVTGDWNIILVYQFRWGSSSCIVEFPGGLLESGESQEEGACREYREETGYEIGRLISLGSVWVDPTSNGAQMYGFLALGCGKVCDAKLDEGEYLKVFEVPIEDWFAVAADPANKERSAAHLAFAFQIFSLLPADIRNRIVMTATGYEP